MTFFISVGLHLLLLPLVGHFELFMVALFRRLGKFHVNFPSEGEFRWSVTRRRV